jgi:hypothetical protein
MKWIPGMDDVFCVEYAYFIFTRGYHAYTTCLGHDAMLCVHVHPLYTLCCTLYKEHDYNDMTTTTTNLKPFHLQPLLSDLYYHKDLLDFSAAGTSYSATS